GERGAPAAARDQPRDAQGAAGHRHHDPPGGDDLRLARAGEHAARARRAAAHREIRDHARQHGADVDPDPGCGAQERRRAARGPRSDAGPVARRRRARARRAGRRRRGAQLLADPRQHRSQIPAQPPRGQLRVDLGRREALKMRAYALALALLAACVAPPQGTPPPAGEAAMIEANRRADAYLRAGDLEGAARQYREAVRVARSVEDPEGIAANAINLSIVYQRLGRNDDARAALAPLLERGAIAFPPERLAQAALRRALLDMEDQRA